MWSQVSATPAIPGRGCPLTRSKHAVCFTEDGHIYLYGGRSMANAPLRDLWRFDTQHNQWEEIAIPRSLSSIVQALPTSISFHGQHHHHNSGHHPALSHHHSGQRGSMLTRSTTLEDSHRYAHSPESQDSETFQNHEPPPSLQEHTMISANERLYLFGGQVGFASDETPLWIFDLQDSSWRKFRPRLSDATSRPIGRRGHSAVLYHSHLMAIYGGYQDLRGSLSELWIFDMNSEEWHKETDKTHPPNRHAHSAVVYQNSMFVYGGMTDLQTRGDFWEWNFKSRKWNRIKALKNPGQLCSHSAIVVNDSMFVYGGQRSKEKAVNELWQYRFDTQTWFQITLSGLVPGCRTQHVAVANPFINFFEPEMKSKKSKKTLKKAFQNYRTESIEQQNHQQHNCGDNFSPKLSITSKPEMESFSEKDENEFEEKEKLEQEIVAVQQTIAQPEMSTETDEKENSLQLKQQEVRLRQRPILQRQRPYSDVASNTAIAEELFQAWRNNTLNNRSVEESMSYYSLCFPTPQKLASPPKVQIPEPSSAPIVLDNAPSQFVPVETVKRRENTQNIRSRIRRANLELKELNCVLRGKGTVPDSKHPASWHPDNSSAYYSLSLDISPDYEKELNFRCSEESSPSNCYDSNRNAPNGRRDLDLLEDYLEPEEMLEIVQDDSNSDDYRLHKKATGTPRIGKTRKQSVSHSSSGYQSFILTDSSDETTSGSPLSLTQEDNQILTNLKTTLCKTIPSTSQEPYPANKTASIQNAGNSLQQASINTSTQTSTLHSPEVVRNNSIFVGTRPNNSWKRLSQWKPNIRETIKEVIVPSSPMFSRRSQSVDSQTSKGSLTQSSRRKRKQIFGGRRKQKRIETGRNEKQKRSKLSRILYSVSWRHKTSRNDSWRLCMYVFGGKESDANSTSLHSQPITIWKFYI